MEGVGKEMDHRNYRRTIDVEVEVVEGMTIRRGNNKPKP